jgi:hypothetical protein
MHHAGLHLSANTFEGAHAFAVARTKPSAGMTDRRALAVESAA